MISFCPPFEPLRQFTTLLFLVSGIYISFLSFIKLRWGIQGMVWEVWCFEEVGILQFLVGTHSPLLSNFFGLFSECSILIFVCGISASGFRNLQILSLSSPSKFFLFRMLASDSLILRLRIFLNYLLTDSQSHNRSRRVAFVSSSITGKSMISSDILSWMLNIVLGISELLVINFYDQAQQQTRTSIIKQWVGNGVQQNWLIICSAYPDRNIIIDWLAMSADHDETLFHVVYLLIIVLLMIYAVAGTFFEHKHFHLLHQTGLGILIGAGVGAIVYYGYGTEHEHGYQFNQNIFFYGLLPPIIFEGGYNLKKAKIFENFAYIAIFGILGTVVAFFVIMSLTFVIESAGLIINSKDGEVVTLGTTVVLLFSATICATDSVAALTMIKPQKYPKLFSIVFGEGMVNDAVAIILFRSVLNIFGKADSAEISAGTVFNILLKFLIILVVSLLIGIASGLLCTLMFKHWRFLNENVISQIILTFLFGAFAYATCELLDYSGVISVLVCGITMAHFNFYNISLTGQLSTQITFRFISFAAEAFIFVYLGLTMWNYLGGSYAVSWSFVGFEFLICSLGRFSSVFVVSGLFYLIMRKKWKVNFFQLGIVWYAGLIRGSVAFALILTVPVFEGYKEQVEIIKSGTLIMVLVTTVVLGASMPFYIKCSLSKSERIEQRKRLAIEAAQLESQVPLVQKKKKESKFKHFDQTYLKPFFIYDYINRKPQILIMKQRMKMNSDQFQGAEYIREAEAISNKKIKESLMQSVQQSENQKLVDQVDKVQNEVQNEE